MTDKTPSDGAYIDPAASHHARAPTVLQVIPALESGGAERTTLEIAQGLVAAGGRALVASRGGRMVDGLEAVGARLHTMPVHSKNPLTMMGNARALAAIIRREGVDIIHARSRAPAWSALVAARRTGVPLVTTFHGAYSAATSLKRFYNSSMVRGDGVIANSAFTAARIRADYPLTEKRLHVIPRGADLDLFRPGDDVARRGDDLRRSWMQAAPTDPEGGGARLLLLPARLSPWKGHDIALAALALLIGQKAARESAGAGVNLRLVFCGASQRDTDHDDLRRRADALGVAERVVWHGHCDDMPAAYCAADLVLAPSTRPEAFGRTSVEAGAMERIAIGADHGGARETIDHGKTGFLATPGAPEALASAITTALALSPGERMAMEKAARARIETIFSTQAMVRATLAVYDQLRNERGKR